MLNFSEAISYANEIQDRRVRNMVRSAVLAMASALSMGRTGVDAPRIASIDLTDLAKCVARTCEKWVWSIGSEETSNVDMPRLVSLDLDYLENRLQSEDFDDVSDAMKFIRSISDRVTQAKTIDAMFAAVNAATDLGVAALVHPPTFARMLACAFRDVDHLQCLAEGNEPEDFI